MQLCVNEVVFRGNSTLPEQIRELDTPAQIFTYFFTPEIMSIVAEETNRCAVSQDINTSFSINVDDIYKYIGIHLYMSIYRYPNLESYWGKHAFEPIRTTMIFKRFELIKRYLSFRNEEDRIKKGQPGYDPLFRMRNISNQLNERFDSVPKTARLCVDEQMCSTKMKHHLRQYMPNKPHKWGMKLFVLCDSFGYAYRFEIYNGAGDNKKLPGCPDLGSSANVVIRLSQTVPDFKNYIIYFDNFYTSIPLLVYLRARGIYSLGTIRVNRVATCKLPSDTAVKKEARGYSIEFVGQAYGIDIATVLWKDNKSVRLASSYVGIKPFEHVNPNHQPSKASRYDRKKKQHVEIDCPEIIKEYNRHMGGVDLMDGLMGRYHVRAKTRDAASRLFYHLIDMSATNAYLLYRRIHAEKMNDSKSTSDVNLKLLDLAKFREEIAAGLIKYSSKRVIGRPSTLVDRPSTSNSRPSTPVLGQVVPVGHRAIHPVADVRYDGFDHFPVWLPKAGGKQLCKNGKCKSQTQCVCKVCNVHLCCSTSRNCFLDYHSKK